MRAFVSRHAVALYFITTFAISWGGILLVIGGLDGFSGATGKDDPLFPLVYLAMLAGPVISGLLFTGLVDGRAGFQALGERLLNGRVGLPWYALALLTAPIVVSIVLIGLSSASPSLMPAIFTSDSRLAIVGFALAVGLGAGIFEELGWTGFAIPRLLARHSVLKTGIIAGLLWAAWHTVAVAWGIGETAHPVPVALFITIDLLSGLPAYRVVMVWTYSRTRSLPLAMLMHASLTTTLLLLAPASASGIDVLRMDVLVALLLWTLVVPLSAYQRASRLVPRNPHRPSAPRRFGAG